jgi:hypothetical protein
MILGILAILALIVWFFFATVTLFASTSSLQLTETGRVLAAFPKEAVKQIQPGQAAILRLTTSSDKNPVVIRTVVFSVDGENGQAEILPVSEDIPPELAAGDLQGNVSVEVAYVTPISLLLRATGYGGNVREMPVSPQSSQGINP